MSLLQTPFEVARQERELADRRRHEEAERQAREAVRAVPAPVPAVQGLDGKIAERLVVVLERLAAALERHPDLPSERLAFRAEELADALGVSRRALDRDRSAGAFPPPSRIIGAKTPVWSRAAIEEWLATRK